MRRVEEIGACFERDAFDFFDAGFLRVEGLAVRDAGAGGSGGEDFFGGQMHE